MPAVFKQYEKLWSELMAIARWLPPSANTPGYANPAYFSFFGHYSADLLNDDGQLELTAFGIQVVANQEQLSLYPSRSKTGVVDEEVLHKVLSALSVKQGSDGCSGIPCHTVVDFVRPLNRN